MKKFFPLFLFLLALVFSSCQVSSRTAFYGNGGRTAYNLAVQSTNAEEMILNLVRMRYFDSPFFLEVSNVTTQFTYKSTGSASVKIPGFDNNNPVGLGGEFSFQNQPTLQYSPLGGQKFAKQIAQNIDLKTIQSMVYAGWNVKRVFRLLIQSFIDSPAMPIGYKGSQITEEYLDSFYEATELLRHFQLRGTLELGIKSETVKSNGDDGKVVEILQIAFPVAGPESERLSKLLRGDVKVSNGRYVASTYVGFQPKGKIGVMTRSIMSCIFYLSQGVQVPEGDIKSGKVSVTPEGKNQFDVWKKLINSLITVKYSYSAPKDAYVSVYYRNKWFYIDDKDLVSKKTFALLQHLYNWQAGQDKKDPPLLSIPLGIG